MYRLYTYHIRIYIYIYHLYIHILYIPTHIHAYIYIYTQIHIYMLMTQMLLGSAFSGMRLDSCYLFKWFPYSNGLGIIPVIGTGGLLAGLTL